MGKIADYLVLLRFPGLGGLAIPPVIAAMTVETFDLVTLSLLFLLGAYSSIFGFVLNDYVDIEVDKQSKELKDRPLVSGSISQQAALWICFTMIMLTFVTFFILFYGETITALRFSSVLFILIAWILGSIYDVYGKKIFASDILVALSVAFIFLIGAFALNKEPTLFTWIIFVLTFNNLFHMNAIEGGIKDADHDVIMNVNNIALRFGVSVNQDRLFIPLSFKILSMSVRLSSILLLFVPFVFFDKPFYSWQLLILGIASAGVLFFSLKLLTLKQFDRGKIRKYISIQSFLRYSLVPLMLLSLIDVIPALILIFLPIIWYLVFTPLTGVKLLQPRM
ncbi:MAG: UbiA family prenyltransferase [Candidatus Thermoplasmatota archaeon]|nr:UbiA family prenyltransferase [Candidatus Thermoplasmatota archaeon]MBS3801820.1 UbiA family prenyltransferase [Candidatus Thermoplasmatota archaeon]